jgi:4-amino-4-deoxy-L-arabinose transferase-like glycosyltransferase
MKEYLKKNLLLDLCFLLFAYVVLFNQLGRQPIHMWDEGFYAMNALEMSFNNNYLVKYYDGKPEMCATEPPLAAWLQLLSVKAFGYDEAVYRIPSALAALLVAFLIINFCSEELKNRKLGYFSACVLLLSPGYNGYHIATTADLDSLLVLFMFFYAINFYKYLKYQRTKYFYYAVLGLLLAFFTKSIVSFMFLPPLFIYAIYKKKLHFVFSHKEIYIGIISFLLVTCGYYLLRESVNPGYINAAWQNEIASRFTKVSEGHHGSFSFYVENFFNSRFSPWFALLPLSLLFIVIRKLYKNDLVVYFSYCVSFPICNVFFQNKDNLV